MTPPNFLHGYLLRSKGYCRRNKRDRYALATASINFLTMTLSLPPQISVGSTFMTERWFCGFTAANLPPYNAIQHSLCSPYPAADERKSERTSV